MGQQIPLELCTKTRFPIISGYEFFQVSYFNQKLNALDYPFFSFTVFGLTLLAMCPRGNFCIKSQL